jgi:hypothetical protein
MHARPCPAAVQLLVFMPAELQHQLLLVLVFCQLLLLALLLQLQQLLLLLKLLVLFCLGQYWC